VRVDRSALRQAPMSITYLEAIRRRRRAPSEDPRVFIYGQDRIVRWRFQSDEKSRAKFPGRVLDAPISEDAMVGAPSAPRLKGCAQSLKCSSPTSRDRLQPSLITAALFGGQCPVPDHDSFCLAAALPAADPIIARAWRPSTRITLVWW
jgi:hypothetical protein